MPLRRPWLIRLLTTTTATRPVPIPRTPPAATATATATVKGKKLPTLGHLLQVAIRLAEPVVGVLGIVVLGT